MFSVGTVKGVSEHEHVQSQETLADCMMFTLQEVHQRKKRLVQYLRETQTYLGGSIQLGEPK